MIEIFSKNKLKTMLSAGAVALILTAVVFFKDDSKAQESVVEIQEKIVAVKVQKASDFKNSSARLKYPATVSPDQEIRVTSAVFGTAATVNFNLGDKVFAGQTLVRIDDIGGELEREEDGFTSGEIQRLRNLIEQAEESYDQAKDNYRDDKNDANKSAKEIAELQRENAKIALRAAIDGRIIKAPFSGTVISKEISQGDSVSVGQLLAVVSKTEKNKIRFFVDRENVSELKVGMKISVFDSQKETSAKISSVSPVADVQTKRFLIEAVPEDPKSFLIGTVVAVSFDSSQVREEENNFILPLSILTISQNETYFFIKKDGKAEKIPVEISKVNGETAEVRAEISPDDLIVTDGSKLVQDGEEIEISNSPNFPASPAGR